MSFRWAEEERNEKKAHGDDAFVAFAESLKSVGLQVHSSGPLLIPSHTHTHTEEEQKQTQRRRRLAGRTCLCTAARAAVPVAAVVKPEWAREQNIYRQGVDSVRIVRACVRVFKLKLKQPPKSCGTHANSFFGFDGHVVGLG